MGKKYRAVWADRDACDAEIGVRTGALPHLVQDALLGFCVHAADDCYGLSLPVVLHVWEC